MSEQDNSQLEGTNPELLEEELDIEVEEESTDTQEELAKKDEIIRQLTARAKKAETLIKSKATYKPNEDIDGIKSVVSRLELAEKKRQFGYENNLSPEEADYIFKINNKPSKELLEDPFIKGGLEAIRSAKRTAENMPSTSSRSPRFEMPKKEDITEDDKQKAFEEYRKEKFGK
jgi:hypothetical protein